MGHGKVPLNLIQCSKHPKETFLKRIKGLRCAWPEKASELVTLCGTEVCMVHCGPNGGPPETWPENQSEVLPINEWYEERIDTEKKGSTADVSTMLGDETKKMQQGLIRSKRRTGASSAHYGMIDWMACQRELLIDQLSLPSLPIS